MRLQRFLFKTSTALAQFRNRLLTFAPGGEEPTAKGPKAGELVGGIDVILDHIKSKIVEPAEAPDGNGEQRSYTPLRILQQQQN